LGVGFTVAFLSWSPFFGRNNAGICFTILLAFSFYDQT
jgi:hypothetical protein